MSSSRSSSTSTRSTVAVSAATRWACVASDNHLPSRLGICASRSLVSTTGGDRKFSRTKVPRPSPS
ncbi:Uncharacterised protein [Mycobacterium tuberculosis]|nr:Uncharacterised protein [Mycobacterium tuberculosis]COW63061.1 Uncharacterised protein [Mycobacterium tuberculosis]COZ63416.1 Uncharacterised protein [Mycobacterium tuberculosis]